MLTFDCETSGLDGSRDRLTCVCLYDASRGIKETFVFDQPPDSEDSLQKRAQVIFLLDEAEQLCAYNGARFDAVFLAKNWKLPAEHVAQWLVKLVDIFEACKLALNITFGLNALLAANGLESKTGSGLEAVRMAEEGRWEELASYCLMDVLLTDEVTSLPVVTLPKTHTKWSRERGFFIE